MATKIGLFIFFIFAVGCQPLRVDIHPEHIRVPDEPTNITVTCSSTAPITDCQFSWWARDYSTNSSGPVLDLGEGAESKANTAHLEGKHGYDAPPLLSYAYTGRGLRQGDCGVRMEVKASKRWLIACRVKALGGWTYNWTHLSAYMHDPLPFTQDPREMVVVPGGQSRILMKIPGKLDECYIHLRVTGWLYLNEGANASNSSGRSLYYGAGLSAGECGLSLANITEEDNGLIWSQIWNVSPRSFDSSLTPLIVARPPTTLALTKEITGDVIKANCRVPESRPAPNITWSLGEKVLRQDSEDDATGGREDPWRWPWSAGPTDQTIILVLRAGDNGKLLKCTVTHVALTRPLEAAEVVHYKGTPPPTTANTPSSPPMTPTTTQSPAQAVPGLQMESSRLVGGAPQALLAALAQLQNSHLKGGAAAQLEEDIGRLNLEAAKAKAEAAKLQLEGTKARDKQEVARIEAAAQLAEEIGGLNLEVAKAKAEAEKLQLEVGKVKDKQEEAKREADAQLAKEIGRLSLEAAKARAETHQLELEAMKIRLTRENEAAETRHKQDEAKTEAAAQLTEQIGWLNLEAAKAKAEVGKLDIEAARSWNKIAEEELEFQREWHRRQLNNSRPLVATSTGD